MRLDDLLAELPQLSKADRAKVVVACQMLGAGTLKKAGVTDADELMWEAYRRSVATLGIELPPVVVAKRMKVWASYRGHCEALEVWVRKHMRPVDEIERMKAFRLLADAVTKRICAWTTPSAHLLLSSTKDATSAVDQAFPGYAQAGLLRNWVMQKHVG